jgi:ribosomal protein L7Ae-like RNA K-turn-binding protein
MYLLDANTYIQAKNVYYQMSFCPAYWAWLDQQFEASTVASIQLVYDELVDGDDELSEWVKERKAHFMPVSSDAIQDKFVEVAQYAAELDGKKPENVAEFLAKADPWLVATAAVSGATVVTHESLVPESSTKVKIPNICKEFGVPYISTFQLLKVLEARFVLA